ncbi:MAG: Rpn family recombination-promoting nuclease/putative transposase [Magnetococcales bacterium]|nr:Rpn family recombination-promoting nuclease/putative transposase [Magnetococcales bacterium]MBF0148487.1 Rpn family recombination-promoting nuclease/putative transposase [Magnetococcales bacterium]
MTDHDSIYHRLFSHPGMVMDLLEHFLDAPLLAELDLSRLTRLNTKFTATTGQRRRGDMVWELPTRTGGSLFVLLILEFQSEIDEWMVLRLNVYAGLLYQQLVDERRLKPADGLPPILPIVLYNGEPGWNAAASLRELIRLSPDSPLWPYQPELRYHIIDEGRFPEDDLQGRPSLTAMFIRMQHAINPESMLKASRDVVTWFAHHPEGPPVKRLFGELLSGGLDRLKGPTPVPAMPEDFEEVVNMLARYVEQWEKDIERKGRQEGRQEGEAKMLTSLLQRRFGTIPEWAGEKISKANPAILEAWGLRIFDARSLVDVFEDPK